MEYKLTCFGKWEDIARCGMCPPMKEHVCVRLSGKRQMRMMQMKRISKDEYYLRIALAVSKRSTCLKRHYGCVIVKNDEIIATGYNGAPRGETNCCDVGLCQRLNKPHNSGDYSDCHSVHAEQNAMLSASRKEMIGAIMYLAGEEFVSNNNLDYWQEVEDATPCPICERMIKNAGIISVKNVKSCKNLFTNE